METQVLKTIEDNCHIYRWVWNSSRSKILFERVGWDAMGKETWKPDTGEYTTSKLFNLANHRPLWYRLNLIQNQIFWVKIEKWRNAHSPDDFEFAVYKASKQPNVINPIDLTEVLLLTNNPNDTEMAKAAFYLEYVKKKE